MKRSIIAISVMSLWLGSAPVAQALPQNAELRDGVGPASSSVVGSAVVPSSGGGLINFDDGKAPCTMASMVALRLAGEVTFSGRGQDGGAILDACSGFKVSGYSAPNFLAFNCAGVLADGGIPRLPERITFPTEMSTVSLKVGSRSDRGKVLALVADGPLGKEVQRVVLRRQLETVTFTGAIERIRIPPRDVCVFVLDDLSFS